MKYLIAFLLGAATVWGGIWIYTWAVLESFKGFDQHDDDDGEQAASDAPFHI